jgi:hypothetical protein
MGSADLRNTGEGKDEHWFVVGVQPYTEPERAVNKAFTSGPRRGDAQQEVTAAGEFAR